VVTSLASAGMDPIFHILRVVSLREPQVSGYKDGAAWAETGAGRSLPSKLLAKSASVRGFFLNNFTKLWKEHMMKLAGLVMDGVC
jgi:hypothetical protein